MRHTCQIWTGSGCHNNFMQGIETCYIVAHMPCMGNLLYAAGTEKSLRPFVYYLYGIVHSWNGLQHIGTIYKHGRQQEATYPTITCKGIMFTHGCKYTWDELQTKRNAPQSCACQRFGSTHDHLLVSLSTKLVFVIKTLSIWCFPTCQFLWQRRGTGDEQ